MVLVIQILLHRAAVGEILADLDARFQGQGHDYDTVNRWLTNP